MVSVAGAGAKRVWAEAATWDSFLVRPPRCPHSRDRSQDGATRGSYERAYALTVKTTPISRRATCIPNTTEALGGFP